MKYQNFLKEVEECEDELDYLDPKTRAREVRKLKKSARRINDKTTRKLFRVSREYVNNSR
jgi:hypothetical protein